MRVLDWWVAAVILAGAGGRAAGAVQTRWAGGEGDWGDAAKWSAGLPNPREETAVRGKSVVRLASGLAEAGDLEVGLEQGDAARVEVTGGELRVMQDSLRVGEHTGSSGTFVLKGGTVESTMDVFVGAASAIPGRGTRAELDIAGGTFLGRSLTVGLGFGAASQVKIEGSEAAAVEVLDYVELWAHGDAGGKAGVTTLAFTLDAQGVTPITIASRVRGLRIEADEGGTCSLAIALTAAPPREDVTLVSSRVATIGTFHGLPEGSAVMADFEGRTYRWLLTYQGGKSGHDLVLMNRSVYAAGAPVTHVRVMPTAAQGLWQKQQIYPLAVPAGRPAFERAEGYGADAAGGRGGATERVENLNDDGPGSLRAAVEAQGARRVVFRVGGVIELKSPLVITEPYLTLDGEDAPGEGIEIRNQGIQVRTHDVVLRYFRVRIGDDAVKARDPAHHYAAGDGITGLEFVEGSHDCIADHLSPSWSTNKLLSVTKMADRITIQWCMLSESLNFAKHGYASIAGGNRVTWHHNLFAHNLSRSVRFQGVVDADFRNNVVYDWGDAAGYGEFEKLNYVGNYLKPGPSTVQRPLLFHEGDRVVMPGSIFLMGNVLEGDARVNADNWKGMGYYYYDRGTLAAAQAFPAPPVKTTTADQAYAALLAGAGDTLPRRDGTDARVVEDVRGGTGRIIDHLAEVGGWPAFAAVRAKAEEGGGE